MKSINWVLKRLFGVAILPAPASGKMLREYGCVMESSGYPAKQASSAWLFRCASWVRRTP